MVDEAVRRGNRWNLFRKLPEGVPKAKREELAATLEAAIHASAQKPKASAKARTTLRDAYNDACLVMLRETLDRRVGEFPDVTVSTQLCAGAMTPEEAVALADVRDEPRDVCRRMFMASLLGRRRSPASRGEDSDRLKDDRKKAHALAQALETSCYNATFRKCNTSESPFRKAWYGPDGEKTQFLLTYSGRCATVNSHLDPEGSACREFGTAFLDDIIAGKIKPESVGELTAAEMCPAASQTERDNIRLRSMQKVETTWSDMYKCPTCQIRKCTYFEKASRALDEPTKVICMCANGHKFVV
ncbi:MAG: hypothetical protein KGL39_26655 [Patescibacteria group bacterium]|nr:hypothetical protein [Patescibacteria group bacterium]